MLSLCYCSSIILDMVKMKVNLAEEPKLWSSYIGLIFPRCLDVTPVSVMDIRSVITKLWDRSESFSALKTRAQYYSCCISQRDSWITTIFKPFPCPPSVHVPGTVPYKCTGYRSVSEGSNQCATAASGSMIFNSAVHSNRAFCYHFRLHPALRINVTFYAIKSSTNMLHIVSYSDKDKDSQTFIGSKSFFSIFPKHKNVDITQIYHPDSPLKINGTFCVLENYFVCSIPITIVKQYHMHTYVIRNKYSLISYTVIVEKIMQIVLKVSDLILNEHKIFDGPSALSDSMETKPVQTCSTFQCTIYFLANTTNTAGLNNANFFTYHSKLLPVQANISNILNKHVMHLPNNICSKHTCVLSIDAKIGHQVNVTANKISLTGFNNLVCLFGGLVVAEHLQGNYLETDTLCNQHDGTVNPSRSLYSQRSSLILLLYWYKSHGTINTTVTISTTECQSVTIHAENFHHNCEKQYSTPKCLSYLKQVTQHSEYFRTFQNIFSHGIISFTQSAGTCIVYIFSKFSSFDLVTEEKMIKIAFKDSQIKTVKGMLMGYKSNITLYHLCTQESEEASSQLCASHPANNPGKKFVLNNTSHIFQIEMIFNLMLLDWVEVVSKVEKTSQAISVVDYFRDVQKPDIRHYTPQVPEFCNQKSVFQIQLTGPVAKLTYHKHHDLSIHAFFCYSSVCPKHNSCECICGVSSK